MVVVSHLFSLLRKYFRGPGVTRASHTGPSLGLSISRQPPGMAGSGTAAANATDASTERHQIMETLSSCRFNKGQTATMLGMSRSTLWRKMKEYHIEG